MGMPSLLVWTLLLSGLMAFFLLVVRRLAVARYGSLPPIGAPQSAFMALMTILASAELVLLWADIFGGAHLSPVTRLLNGLIVVLIGVSNLYQTRTMRARYPSQRKLGALCLALGAVQLAIGGYSYAISLGTAASWSLR